MQSDDHHNEAGGGSGPVTDRRKERLEGVLSILLFLVILIGGQILLTGLLGEGNLIAAVGPTVLALVVFVARYFKTLAADKRRLTRKSVIFAIAMGVLAVAAGSGVAELLTMLNVTVQETVNALVTQDFVIMFLVAITYGPIVEELVYRKALSQILRNDIVFAIVSIVLFGLAHEGLSVGSIATMVSGTCFTIAYLRTGKNVMAAVIAHFTSNLGAMILMMLFGI